MDTALILHNFEGRRVRTHVDEQGLPWFSAKDVCSILEIANHRDAVSKLDDDEKVSVLLDGSQKQVVVNESGLYSLIFRSNKMEAKRFKKWITGEVLPSIRRTGSYSTQDAWIKSRQDGKLARRIATDTIKDLVPYAANQGSNHPDKLFMVYSKAINDALLDLDGQKKPNSLRDQLNTIQLTTVATAEVVLARSIYEQMAQGIHYKEIFQNTKARIHAFAETVGRTRIGASERECIGLSSRKEIA
jgi:prophage antirepressor-like protein